MTEIQKQVRQVPREFSIIRIMQTDVPGNKKVFVGLTYIKGVSWAISNALCKILDLNQDKKISELSEDEIKKISEFLKNPTFLDFLYNRRKDFETGKNYHIITSGLDMSKEFDIRRLKKIRSYRGLRHALGQPVRGQSTRSHFRKRGKGKAVGVRKTKGVKQKWKDKRKNTQGQENFTIRLE